MLLYELKRNTPVKLGDDTLLYKYIDGLGYGVFEVGGERFIGFSPSQEIKEKDGIYFITID